jgi:hypothetical protein
MFFAIVTKYNRSCFSIYFWIFICCLSLLLFIVLLLPRFLKIFFFLLSCFLATRVARGSPTTSPYVVGLILLFWIITFQTMVMKHFVIVLFLCFYFYL